MPEKYGLWKGGKCVRNISDWSRENWKKGIPQVSHEFCLGPFRYYLICIASTSLTLNNVIFRRPIFALILLLISTEDSSQMKQNLPHQYQYRLVSWCIICLIILQEWRIAISTEDNNENAHTMVIRLYRRYWN